MDLHPVVLDADGDGVQAGPHGTTSEYPAACFVIGRIDGRAVDRLSVPRQLAAHEGYEPRDVDRLDLAVLRALASG